MTTKDKLEQLKSKNSVTLITQSLMILTFILGLLILLMFELYTYLRISIVVILILVPWRIYKIQKQRNITMDEIINLKKQINHKKGGVVP